MAVTARWLFALQAESAAELGWWQQLSLWLSDHSMVLWWMFWVSLGSLVLCALLLPVIVLRLPADYFATVRDHKPAPGSMAGWVLRIGKNVLGVLFVLVGVLLLLLPGQGLLTMLIGLMLLDFPGKRALERRIIGRPAILKLLNRMRTRRGFAALIVD